MGNRLEDDAESLSNPSPCVNEPTGPSKRSRACCASGLQLSGCGRLEDATEVSQQRCRKCLECCGLSSSCFRVVFRFFPLFVWGLLGFFGLRFAFIPAQGT